MSRAMRWISKLVLPVLFLNLTACALFMERPGPSTFIGPREQVFYASFEEVWRATNLVLQPYPLRVSNMDQGILETDSIRGYRIFTPVYKKEGSSNAEQYKLVARVIRGKLEKRDATKVTITRDLSLQSDFFSDPKYLPSDGLEEKVLLYRIGREIQIERALAKAQKKQNQPAGQQGG